MIDEVFMFVFKGSHDKIIIDKSILERITDFGTMPMLWCRDGEYCVIPKEVIQNAIDSHEMSRQENLKRTSPVITIQWSQGIPINNAAGRILIGE